MLSVNHEFNRHQIPELNLETASAVKLDVFLIFPMANHRLT